MLKHTVVFCSILWLSLHHLTLSQEDTDSQPLDVLGDPSWTRLRPGWSLTVNDQCLYEFRFQFEHDSSLPLGDEEFKNTCSFDKTKTKLEEATKISDVDGHSFLQPRQMWERFPEYVYATTGFAHLSVDWQACGRRPKGYTTPQYDFSFFRVSPEYRAETMVCKLIDEDDVAVPGEKICISNGQDDPKGMNFFIVPGAMINRVPVVNMPFDFKRPDHGYGPLPHYGLRSWDQENVPNSPKDWTDDIPIFMSSYAGNLVMWQAHVPYKMISGRESKFVSGAARYFETTVETLPDTWAVDYDASEGVITFIMVGRAGICREDFEKAQEAAGGAPIFPNYDDLFAETGSDQSSDEDNEDNEDGTSESGAFSPTTRGSGPFAMQILFLYLGYITLFF